uniref:Ig-like domain-containing protein n=1 Tax=Takifugu rubripes TaxID=31033 RepID=A0A674ME09_TAKRU
ILEFSSLFCICSYYGVEYPLANICVLENSSVFIPCTFFYPAGSSVTRVMWGHERNDLYEGPFLYDSDNLNLTSRFRYNGDKKNNCSFTIQNIGCNDSGKYAFRFETIKDTGKFTDPLSDLLELSARRLQPSVGGTIKEGDSVHLVCENPCNRTHQSITWFKNGVPVREGSKLDLGPVSPSDSGNYTCSLSDHPGTTTAAVHVDVECENRKQNHSFTKLKSTRRLMPNVSFQTDPRTREAERTARYDDIIYSSGWSDLLLCDSG